MGIFVLIPVRYVVLYYALRAIVRVALFPFRLVWILWRDQA